MIRSFLTPASLLAIALGFTACATQGGVPADVRASVTLPGIRYEVLKSGPITGAHPRRVDDIVVRYEGRLTNGKLFDSSAGDPSGTATFPLGKLIPGWIAALQLMRPGDEWMIYLPAYMAYGDKGADPIPPGSDLAFKVELISIKSPSSR